MTITTDYAGMIFSKIGTYMKARPEPIMLFKMSIVLLSNV